MSLEDVESLLIRKAMTRYGNVTHAAKALGLEPLRALPAARTLQAGLVGGW